MTFCALWIFIYIKIRNVRGFAIRVKPSVVRLFYFFNVNVQPAILCTKPDSCRNLTQPGIKIATAEVAT